jgi:hypothetical protein
VQEGEVVMGEIRRWTVEAKEFELVIKGGLLGVRIVEKRNNRQRFISVHRDELPWLVGAVEKAANVDTSEVFWDQSRAGYIRLITQRRANRHGRFLTIEEFDGRRRSGSVLVPEGWTGQGWARLISELRLACSSLKVGSGLRLDKSEMVTAGKKSYAEAVGETKRMEKKDPSLLKPSSDVGLLEGRAPASEGDMCERIPTSTKPMPGTTQITPGMGGHLQKPQSSSKIESAGDFRRSSVWPAVMQGVLPCNPRGSVLGVEGQGAQGKVKGPVEGAFNVKQELRGLREWLLQLRCDVDAGLKRVDVVIKKMVGNGPGQMKKKKSWIPKQKPKNVFRIKDKRLNSSGKGVDVGSGLVASSDEAGPSTGRHVVFLKPNPEVLGGVKNMGLGLNDSLAQNKGIMEGMG